VQKRKISICISFGILSEVFMVIKYQKKYKEKGGKKQKKIFEYGVGEYRIVE
jgi:hypothetical protein